MAFQHQDVDYTIAVRVGTTSLVTALRQKGVDIAVATCNLIGDAVVAALARRCDVFDGIPVHVIESRDKGAKSLESLGLKGRRAVIFDDSLGAWVPEDQEFVFTAERFDVVRLADYLAQDDDAGDAAVDRELGYLTSIRESLLNWFDGPSKLDFDDDFSDDPGTPRPERSRSFSAEAGPRGSSPELSGTKRGASESPGDVANAKRPRTSSGTLSDTNKAVAAAAT